MAVLERTPMDLRPRKTPVSLDKDDSICDTLPPPISPTIRVEVTPTTEAVEFDKEDEQLLKSETNFYTQNLLTQTLTLGDESEKKKMLTLDVTPEEEKQDIKKSESNEFLSPSPVFRFSTFDSQSFDMVATPDEIANSSFLGLSNVNYDIEFSDLSADNSIIDDRSPEKLPKSPTQKDPFSPINNDSCIITQPPLVPASAAVDEMSTSLIDVVETGTPENLPSPIKPLNSEYSGFSTQGWQIPSIPCHTGDYSSLNAALPSPSTSEAVSVQNGVDSPKNKINNEDGAVRILGGVLETLDKLF